MREAANDLEYAIARNQAGTAGGAATGRSMASIETWIGATAASASAATQVVLATTTSAATTAPVASGTPGTAPSEGSGTTGALTEASLLLALQSNYDKGSMTDVVVVNGTAKNYINGFTGIATRNVDVGRTSQASITGAADLYVSNYGVHRVVLHRHVRSSVALCLDTSLWAIGTLRGWSSSPLAKTGDAKKRLINCEKTLVCRNPRGNAKVVAIG